MTADDVREKCIHAMADALHDMTDDDPFTRPQELRIATFMLDALNGVAFVDPLEATKEMLMIGGLHSDDTLRDQFAAMAAAGNLTNPPEKKP